MSDPLRSALRDTHAGDGGRGPAVTVPTERLALDAPAGYYVALMATREARPGWTLLTGGHLSPPVAQLLHDVDDGRPGAVDAVRAAFASGAYGTSVDPDRLADQARLLGVADPKPTWMRLGAQMTGAIAGRQHDDLSMPAAYLIRWTGEHPFHVADVATVRAAEAAIYAAAAAHERRGWPMPFDGFVVDAYETIADTDAILSARFGVAPHVGRPAVTDSPS